MQNKSTAERIAYDSKCLSKGIILAEEFGNGAIDRMIHDTACDPIAILKSLPDNHQFAIVEVARKLSANDYRSSPSGDGDNQEEDEDVYHLRRVGELILSFNNAN